MAGRWTVQLLGGLSARQGDRVVSRFRTQRTGALLAYLAFHRGEAVPRERLLDILWPESDLLAARNSLSVALSSLRRQLEPPKATPGVSPLGGVLVADRGTVHLNPDTFTTDVAAFEDALQSARGNGSGGLVDTLTRAVKQYGGDLLPGLFDDWILAERERLAGLYLQSLCRLAAALIDSGTPADALEYARRAAQADPLGEEPHRLLMRVFADLGRPAAVRAQLAELERRRLEAGESPPQSETRWLAHRLAENADPTKIVAVAASPVPSGPVLLSPAPVSAPPGKPPETPARPVPDHLPVPLTRFFGQDETLTALLERLYDPQTRLITLTGPGGCGKTRLALEAARKSAADSSVWFVPLADLRDPGRLAEAVRDSLGSPRTAADPIEQIAERLNGVPSPLIVLDNLEHLLGRGPLDTSGIASQVRGLLTRLPPLRLLVTSRQALGIPSEQEFPVALLAIPPDPDASPAALLEFASVQLFADRARSRRVDFQVTPRNARAVAALVARLEGIPLAIEIAAAWSRLLTPSQMLARLADPFEMLVSPEAQGRGDVPERQRTLWGALAWGYDLLTPDARRVFAALSVFRGDWSAGAAQAVCDRGDGDSRDGDSSNEDLLPPGRTLECLTLLQSASLLVTVETDHEMRFRLLETVREFAGTRLTETERARWERRHANVFVARAEDAYGHRNDPHQNLWLDRLAADLPNFRATLDRFAETGTGLHLASALGTFWKLRGYYREGQDWLERALAGWSAAAATSTNTADVLILGRAFHAAGFLAEDSGDFEAASRFFAQSVEAYRVQGSEKSAASVIVSQGNIAYLQGRYPDAHAYYNEALAISRHLSDTKGIASALGSLGNVAQAEGKYAESRGFQEESLTLSRAIGDDRMTAYTLHNMGNLALCERDPARARALYEESLTGKRALGDRRGVATLQTSLGFLVLEENQTAEAAAYFAPALRTLIELGNKLLCAIIVEGAGWCAAQSGGPLRAARFWAAAAAARTALSAPMLGEDRETFDRLIADARSAASSPAAFDHAWDEGSVLSLDTASRTALTHLETLVGS